MLLAAAATLCSNQAAIAGHKRGTCHVQRSVVLVFTAAAMGAACGRACLSSQVAGQEGMPPHQRTH
jgi:hypothetical protein